MPRFAINRSDSAEFVKTLNEMTQAIYACIEDGTAIVEVRMQTISPKQLRSLFLWFTHCSEALNNNGAAWHNEAGKKGKWNKDRFHAMFKRFIKHYKGLSSTKDQGTKGMNECMEALTGHIATEYSTALPPLPSLEELSTKAMLDAL